METKLTLSMDKQVIEKAKKYARTKNTSLSRLIRSYLVSLTKTDSEKKSEITPLVKSLSGILTSPKNTSYKKQYADYLQKKYK